MECIFGLDWTVAQVRPWILATIELFGPDRCMFASHMPLQAGLQLPGALGAYLEIIADFSMVEKCRYGRRGLRVVAAALFPGYRASVLSSPSGSRSPAGSARGRCRRVGPGPAASPLLTAPGRQPTLEAF
jgi:hypothetical protein